MDICLTNNRNTCLIGIKIPILRLECVCKRMISDRCFKWWGIPKSIYEQWEKSKVNNFSIGFISKNGKSLKGEEASCSFCCKRFHLINLLLHQKIEGKDKILWNINHWAQGCFRSSSKSSWITKLKISCSSKWFHVLYC